MAHTLTTDNGKEFAKHQQIAAALELDYYFAHAYAAWERGANENLNGLLRQFFPKHRALEEVTDEEIALAQHRLNHRPRKGLGYKTPHQIFWAELTGPWCKSGDGRESEIELKTSNWYGDGQAAASRAARGFVGGAHAVGCFTGASIL